MNSLFMQVTREKNGELNVNKGHHKPSLSNVSQVSSIVSSVSPLKPPKPEDLALPPALDTQVVQVSNVDIKRGNENNFDT